MERCTILPFDALTTRQLYALLALRSRVFVVEQSCVYLDPDGLDESAMHLLYEQDGELVGYARMLAFPHGEGMSFGRLVTDPRLRGRGIGWRLVDTALTWLATEHPEAPVRITAQIYLKDFYASFGFAAEGEPFDMDGIIHLQMVKHS